MNKVTRLSDEQVRIALDALSIAVRTQADTITELRRRVGMLEHQVLSTNGGMRE